VASRIRHSKKHAMMRKRRRRSKGDHGDGDIRDALRRFTENSVAVELDIWRNWSVAVEFR